MTDERQQMTEGKRCPERKRERNDQDMTDERCLSLDSLGLLPSGVECCT
jgi:hypothetical protein